LTFPRRGDVYIVNLDPTVGTEVGKSRPALTISNDIGNEHSARVIVAPVTSKGLRRVYPFEVAVPAGEAGLSVDSKVQLDQIRSLDKQRLARRLGKLSEDRMQEVNRAIRISMAV